MDNVNHPAHYNAPGRKECIVEMLEKFGSQKVQAFCELNAYKYKYRHEMKNGQEDLSKAAWYEAKQAELAAAETDSKTSDSDVGHREQGEWVFEDDYDGLARCSRCNSPVKAYEFPENTTLTILLLRNAFKDVYKFCPHCGANMNKSGGEN